VCKHIFVRAGELKFKDNLQTTPSVQRRGDYIHLELTLREAGSDMSTSEIQVRPTPELEVWRVKPRWRGREQNSDVPPDFVLNAIRFTRLCGFAAVDVQTAGILCAQRTHWDARRDGMNDYKVIFQLTGRSALVQDARATKLAAGDLGFIDVSRPAGLICQDEPGRCIGLHLPRRSLISHLGFEPQGGLCWRGDALPGRLLRRFLEDMLVDRDVTLGSAERHMQLAVYNLVGALFRCVGIAAPLLSRR
jgi:hypothetical protein